MCLDTVDKVTKKGRGYGYKVFEDWDGELHPWFIGGQDTVLPEEEWIKDKKRGFAHQPRYRLGFHIYVTLASAREIQEDRPHREIIRRVKYEGVVASGKSERRHVIVARKMLICKGEVK